MNLSLKAAKSLGIVLPEASHAAKVNPNAPYRSSWEKEYHDVLIHQGTVYSVHYERVSFCLVPKSATQKGVWYVPDFTVWRKETLVEVVEVKGHWRPGSKHKVKALAALLAPVPVYVVRKVNNQWERERF